MSKKTLTTDYIQQVRNVHNDQYEYQIFNETVKLKSYISIVCKKHGIFLQRADSHKQGARCKKCVAEIHTGKNNINRKLMLNKFNNLKMKNIEIIEIFDCMKIKYACPTHGLLFATSKWIQNHKKCKECYREEHNKSLQYRRSNKLMYYAVVHWHTRRSWKNFKKFINHYDLTRSTDQYHLDHMYSIDQGFKNNIPPYIIGHWTNLTLLLSTDNIKKSNRSSIGLHTLYNSYQWAIRNFPHSKPQSYTV